MRITKNSKIFLIVLTFVVSMLSAELSSASMHHMDDCMMQTTCNNCFISATTPPADRAISFLFISQVGQVPNPLQTHLTAPPSPPPKI
jgi:hypothetical protein